MDWRIHLVFPHSTFQLVSFFFLSRCVASEIAVQPLHPDIVIICTPCMTISTRVPPKRKKKNKKTNWAVHKRDEVDRQVECKRRQPREERTSYSGREDMREWVVHVCPGRK